MRVCLKYMCRQNMWHICFKEWPMCFIIHLFNVAYVMDAFIIQGVQILHNFNFQIFIQNLYQFYKVIFTKSKSFSKLICKKYPWGYFSCLFLPNSHIWCHVCNPTRVLIFAVRSIGKYTYSDQPFNICISVYHQDIKTFMKIMYSILIRKYVYSNHLFTPYYRFASWLLCIFPRIEL